MKLPVPVLVFFLFLGMFGLMVYAGLITFVPEAFASGFVCAALFVLFGAIQRGQ